jgi:hypothetical protein
MRHRKITHHTSQLHLQPFDCFFLRVAKLAIEAQLETINQKPECRRRI